MNEVEKIKKLRQSTGAGFKDCNTALKESNGDLDKAVEILRVKGIAKASKKMSRDAKEGVIVVSGDENKTSLIEVNCETDFVAKNNDFINFVKKKMIQSMTGFGKAQLELSNSKVNIELKSLNSKHLDLNIKLPKAYKHQELELKKYLTNKLHRGKIEISILFDDFTVESEYTINAPKLKEYHKQILDLKNELNFLLIFREHAPLIN